MENNFERHRWWINQLTGTSKKVATIQEALCKGCGACSVACLTSAASVFHYDDQEVLTVVESALGN